MEKHFLIVILRPSIIICKYSQHVSNKTQLRIAYFDSKQVFTMHAKDIFDQISCKFYFIDLYLIECSIRILWRMHLVEFCIKLFNISCLKSLKTYFISNFCLFPSRIGYMKIKFEFSSEIFGPSYNMQISWKLFLLQGVYTLTMR